MTGSYKTRRARQIVSFGIMLVCILIGLFIWRKPIRLLLGVDSLVRIEDGPSLLISTAHLSDDITPESFDFITDNGQFRYSQRWYCMTKPRDYLTRYDVSLVVLVFPTMQEAELWFKCEQDNTAAIPPRRSTDASFHGFSDDAWVWGELHRVIFIRGNVVCDISTSLADEAKRNTLVNGLAKELGNRIDRLKLKETVSVSAIPVFMNELHCSHRQYWASEDALNTLWDHDAGELIMRIDGVKRILPAKRVGAHAYDVPLAFVIALLDKSSRIVIKNNTANVTIQGRSVTLQDGKDTVMLNADTITLATPVTIRHGQVIVPLSSIETLFPDQCVSWQMDDGVDIAVIQRKR